MSERVGKRTREDASPPEQSNSKRPLMSLTLSSPFEFGAPQGWPRFLLVISQEPDKKLTKLSPCKIQKGLRGIIGTIPTKVSKQFSSGHILVESESKKQSDRLLEITTFAGIKVKVEPHRGLNSSRGVIKSRELEGTVEEELVEDIDGVTQARRVYIRRGGDKIGTNTYILTFNSPKPPATVKFGYCLLRVAPYVPNPLRCFKCQKFGHSQARCNRSKVCARCGKAGHEDRVPDAPDKNCQSTPKYANCQGTHTAFDKQCPVWLQEQEIQRYKAKYGGTFAQAREAVSAGSVVRSDLTFAEKVRTRVVPEASTSNKEKSMTSRQRTVIKNRVGGASHQAPPTPLVNPSIAVSVKNRFDALTEADKPTKKTPLANALALAEEENFKTPPSSPSLNPRTSQKSLPPPPPPPPPPLPKEKDPPPNPPKLKEGSTPNSKTSSSNTSKEKEHDKKKMSKEREPKIKGIKSGSAPNLPTKKS
ncbi:MAG: hypothetical protein MJA29_05960 [Candidatus Omnitrophica bacterium]|nr:hypothetical protein [Candidatus Omnitrophota bacterium]